MASLKCTRRLCRTVESSSEAKNASIRRVLPTPTPPHRYSPRGGRGTVGEGGRARNARFAARNDSSARRRRPASSVPADDDAAATSSSRRATSASSSARRASCASRRSKNPRRARRWVISEALSALSSRTADACAGSGRHSPDETKRSYAAPTGQEVSALKDAVDVARTGRPLVPERHSTTEAACSARCAARGDIATRLRDQFEVACAGGCQEQQGSLSPKRDTSRNSFGVEPTELDASANFRFLAKSGEKPRHRSARGDAEGPRHRRVRSRSRSRHSRVAATWRARTRKLARFHSRGSVSGVT